MGRLLPVGRDQTNDPLGASASLMYAPLRSADPTGEPPFTLGGRNWSSCPRCMDRLPFASEGVLWLLWG
jgi:hypothetical protein